MTDYTDLIARLRMVERKDISSHLYPFAPGVVEMACEAREAIEQLVEERDAAVSDLEEALHDNAEGKGCCSFCEHGAYGCEVCEPKWRGVKGGWEQ